MSHRSPSLSRPCVWACVLLTLAFPPTSWSQSPPSAPAVAGQPPVRGIYNWIHTTGDAESAFSFYREVFGIQLAASPFAAGASEPPEAIRPVSEAASDRLVAQLTNTEGARFRTAFMRARNVPFGLELSEFFDIPRNTRAPNPWDPGAAILILAVRNLDAVAAKLRSRGTPPVTLGGLPLDTPAGRAILVRDPDGYLVEVLQASPAAVDAAVSPAAIVNASIGISVADADVALRFYRGLLGFEVEETRRATSSELRLHGLGDGTLTETPMLIGGTVTVLLLEFELPPSAPQPAVPISWRIQDVGAPQFQLQVADLDGLLERAKHAGYRFLSVGAQPIRRPFGRFVFAIDPDGILVEFVEPSEPR
jgi:catechol 2,3-dioxygenase-like lactoylglutathione lyase family enzyme